MGKPGSAKTRDVESHASRLASAATYLAAAGAFFLLGALLGVIGPRQWLPSSVRAEDPELRALADQLKSKDDHISSLEAQVNLFRSVAELTRQQNQDFLSALKQASAGTMDLQTRIDSERDAKNRAQANAEAARAELQSRANAAPDLETLGYWANGRPTASARALARSIVLPAEGQRPLLIEALAPQNKAIETQKELVMLLHKEMETQQRCQTIQAEERKTWEGLSMAIPACSPSMKAQQCSQLMDQWDEDFKAQNSKYAEISNELSDCQTALIYVDAALMDGISGTVQTVGVTAAK